MHFQVALGVPKETSDKELEEAEGMVAPLVAAAARIIDDRLLMIDEYPEEDDAPASLPVSHDLRKNLIVKLDIVILGVCSPLNNCDIGVCLPTKSL